MICLSQFAIVGNKKVIFLRVVRTWKEDEPPIQDIHNPKAWRKYLLQDKTLPRRTLAGEFFPKGLPVGYRAYTWGGGRSRPVLNLYPGIGEDGMKRHIAQYGRLDVKITQLGD